MGRRAKNPKRTHLRGSGQRGSECQTETTSIVLLKSFGKFSKKISLHFRVQQFLNKLADLEKGVRELRIIGARGRTLTIKFNMLILKFFGMSKKGKRRKRMAKKSSFRFWGGSRVYASTKAGEWPDFVGPNGRRSSKKLAHRLFRRVAKMRLQRGEKNAE